MPETSPRIAIVEALRATFLEVHTGLAVGLVA